MFGTADESMAIKSVNDAIAAGINFFDSSPYYGGGLAERRLGEALRGKRDSVIVGTKAGRYGFDDFDFSPKRIRDGVHASLDLLQTDYVDILQLHDIEFVELGGVFADSYAELVRLRDEGKCRFVGMSGYPLHTIRRAINETDLDVVLNYAHFTLLNTELTDGLLPTADANGTAVINAAAVALGLLTPGGLKQDVRGQRRDGLGVAAGQRAVRATRHRYRISREPVRDSAVGLPDDGDRHDEAASPRLGRARRHRTHRRGPAGQRARGDGRPFTRSRGRVVCPRTTDAGGHSWRRRPRVHQRHPRSDTSIRRGRRAGRILWHLR